MKYTQSDIVIVNFPVGNGIYKQHHAIILSNRNVFDVEEYYLCVMLSTKAFNEEFAFEITPEMVTYETTTTSFAKCQLIATFYTEDILSRVGSLKHLYFRNLLKHLNKTVFSYE